ncbi:HTH-type transcriptional regulator VirS [Paraburkholderia caffeinitolerans]|uniref:HTH-type transcriptional regulator VirS n=1 Tax=Paraburkholderia caffeinitolerans TaxID=1723730 RepID=A0A6J5GQZ8_9BURK|nr:AraC family transcriptional regulator [Paraburkholderia caffeinitolerans]CAB3803651.1 HTH-type transcriptional regulator VirS [Paraburkholderia caffeinitolerans]
MGTLIRTGVMTNYLKVAQQLSFDPKLLLRKLGLSSAMLADPECLIPGSAAVTLLKESARITQCPTFGLRVADLWQLSDLGVVSVLLTHQRTLREAVATLIQYRHLLNEFLVIRMEDVGKKVIVREEFVADETGTSVQSTELVLGSLSRMCSTLLGAAWHPLSVHFTHDAPPDLRLHRRVFVGKLEFASSFNGVICRAADMDFPNPIADPVMARHAQRLLEGLPGAREPSVVLEVRKAIYLLLPVGRATIEQVAQGLGMNVRTLQRQLESAGMVFSDMVNGVRRDLVVHYMENKSHSLGHIAEALGYSAYGSFVRWFEAQFGMTPSQWRSAKSAKGR